MECFQQEISLETKGRGFHLITDEILNKLNEVRDFKKGILTIFIQHTSASIAINENADPTVRKDLEKHFSKYAPEDAPYYEHNSEGSDDMPSHIKAVTIGSSLQIPITNGKLNLGTWQGIYLCEHRNNAGKRKLVLTIIGET